MNNKILLIPLAIIFLYQLCITCIIGNKHMKYDAIYNNLIALFILHVCIAIIFFLFIIYFANCVGATNNDKIEYETKFCFFISIILTIVHIIFFILYIIWFSDWNKKDVNNVNNDDLININIKILI